MTKDGVKHILNEKLEIAIGSYDIIDCQKLQPPRTATGNANASVLRARVVLANKDIKKTIVQAKKKVKGKNSQLSISDDLIPNRAKLAYLARQAKRSLQIHDTWTYDSLVFIKNTALASPTELMHPEDIYQLEHSNTQININPYFYKIYHYN